jgi:hypothetical protein
MVWRSTFVRDPESAALALRSVRPRHSLGWRFRQRRRGA